MVETPRQLLRADYSDTSLPLQTQQRLSELTGHIQETPSAYDAHIEIIKILHQGFVDHIYPSSSPNARRDPKSFDLLSDLRQARESADRVFALGEEQWLDWLQDESILAQSAEDRLSVVEKCRRAVDEEYGSVQLWATYGDWMHHCYKWTQDPTAVTATGLPDDERLVGRELFPWDNVVQVWDQAIVTTAYDMAQSHVVWRKYLTYRFPQFEEKVRENDASQILDLFQKRLQTPHAEWESTFQSFSGFVSANFSNDAYEKIMAETNQGAAPAKSAWSLREPYETAIAEAAKSGDKYAEYQAYVSYIQWEKNQGEQTRRQKGKAKRKQQADPTKVNALFQRAELRIASDVGLWEEHINFMIEQRISGVSGVLSRATKHCPWAGSLWRQYLLTSEILGESFQTIENIKHDATKTGMLEAGGIEEVLKIHDAWCGYLMRKTRKADSVEEDADVAEMGIRTSMEAVQSLASKLELPASFDASFRLQRKHVEYLKGQGRLDNARKQFDDAIPVYGRHYRFWLRFYEFEMHKSLHMNSLHQNSRETVSPNSSAPFAVAILKKGLERSDLDYPEYLIEALINHCEDYEDAEELQSALLLINKVQRQVTARRQVEAEVAAEEASQPPAEVVAEVVAEDRAEAVAENLHIGGKRKREEDEEEPDASKRSRGDAIVHETVEPTNVSQEIKRDRENASILVQHVPESTSETRIRQYFTSCGNVKSVRALHDEESSFIVEFENADEASYAISRDGQTLDNAIISVMSNNKSTLYVTNYPASADDGYIRDLFSSFGEIISIRFPSLQGNKRRRFCYVEFKSGQQAQAALDLDGQERDGLSLIVKISDPSVKKQRSERKAADRTIFVGQLPFKATEDQVIAAFDVYGEIESVKMPQDPNSKSRNKGIAFIIFSNDEAAQAALEMDAKDFQGRKIKVNPTQNQGGRREKSQQSGGRSKSPCVSMNGDAASPASAAPLVDFEERRQRTIALTDIPDTVNEARLRNAAETVGPVRKVILKTNHQGALVEFESAADAGKAAIELDGYHITPDRKMRVTTQKDMYAQQAETKVEKIGKASSMTGIQPKRPQQAGVGARRGGHLGQRKAAVFQQSNGDGGAGDKKSNDDFRNMLKKS